MQMLHNSNPNIVYPPLGNLIRWIDVSILIFNEGLYREC
jgi:hypothetical protein